MKSFYPHNYNEALAYLDAGRTDPSVGRLCALNTRVVHVNFEGQHCMGVKLHDTVVVTFLPNGDFALNTGGWYTSTTKERINTYSPARVGSAYGHPVRLPSGDVWGRASIPSSTVEVPTVAGFTILRRKTNEVWAIDATGDVTAPKVQKCRSCKHCYGDVCYRCKGTGQADYGSKPIYNIFASVPVVDAEGRLVRYAYDAPVHIPAPVLVAA